MTNSCDFILVVEIFDKNFDIGFIQLHALPFGARARAWMLGLKVILRHFAPEHFPGFGNLYSFR